MNKIKFAKQAIKTIVSVGTARIIKGIIENNVDIVTTTDQVTVTAASFAIGGAVGELTAEYTDAKIDEIVEFVQKIKDRKKPNLEVVK